MKAMQVNNMEIIAAGAFNAAAVVFAIPASPWYFEPGLKTETLT